MLQRLSPLGRARGNTYLRKYGMNDISSHELYSIDCSCWLSLCGLLVFYLVSIVPIFTVGITLLCFGMYPKYERSILHEKSDILGIYWPEFNSSRLLPQWRQNRGAVNAVQWRHYSHLTLGRTGLAGGGGWHPSFEIFSFFVDDKTSLPEVSSSRSFILCKHFETSLVMVSYYGYVIWRQVAGVIYVLFCMLNTKTYHLLRFQPDF